MKRPFIFLFLAALMLSAAACAQQNGKDWAKFGRYAQANRELKTAPDVVFMGNSITENWYKFHPGFFEKNNFAGRGISGQTSSEMLVRFRADVIGLKPLAVVILCGINDIAGNNGPIKLENAMGNIVSMCELARVNGIEPVLCSVLPCNRFGWRPEFGDPTPQVLELNGMIKGYADENGIVYVDYFAAMADAANGLPASVSRDGCHPLPDGYCTMERVVTDNLKKVKALKAKNKTYYVSPEGTNGR